MNNWNWPEETARPDHMIINGVEYRVGDRVCLRPKRRADVFDLALNGMQAVIASIEQDFEDRTFLTVILEDDPGQDLGRGGKPGHRFFFEPDEVELLPPEK